jgi:hypothetical protein
MGPRFLKVSMVKNILVHGLRFLIEKQPNLPDDLMPIGHLSHAADFDPDRLSSCLSANQPTCLHARPTAWLLVCLPALSITSLSAYPIE